MEGVSFLAQIVVNAIALFLLDGLMDSIEVVTTSGSGAVLTSGGDLLGRGLVYLGVGLVLAVVNTFIKPVIKLLAAPLYLLTLGLFGLVVNALVLVLVSKLAPLLGFGLILTSFPMTIVAALILSVISALVSIPFRNKDKK
jgi:putative membrane protein